MKKKINSKFLLILSKMINIESFEYKKSYRKYRGD